MFRVQGLVERFLDERGGEFDRSGTRLSSGFLCLDGTFVLLILPGDVFGDLLANRLKRRQSLGNLLVHQIMCDFGDLTFGSTKEASCDFLVMAEFGLDFVLHMPEHRLNHMVSCSLAFESSMLELIGSLTFFDGSGAVLCGFLSFTFDLSSEFLIHLLVSFERALQGGTSRLCHNITLGDVGSGEGKASLGNVDGFQELEPLGSNEQQAISHLSKLGPRETFVRVSHHIS